MLCVSLCEPKATKYWWTHFPSNVQQTMYFKPEYMDENLFWNTLKMTPILA